MNLYAILGISFIPAVLFFILSRLLNPEFKVRYGLLASALGLATVFPTSLIQFFLLETRLFSENSFASVMITAIIFNGLIEETMKMLFMCAIPQKKQSLGAFACCAVIYALFAGGFESVVYIIRKFQEITLASGSGVILNLLIRRIFSAQAVHVFCALLSALYLWSYRHFKSKNIMPFFYAFLLHGIYNFFTGFTSGFRWFSFVAIVFAAVECRIFYSAAKSEELKK